MTNFKPGWLFRGLVYSTMGASAEIFFTATKRTLDRYQSNRNDRQLWKCEGETQIWVYPIYFFGGTIVFERLHEHLRNYPSLFRLSIYACLFLLIEYLTGRLYERILGCCPWKYRLGTGVLGGYANLKYFPLWALVGAMAEVTHDYLSY
jgi:uncharacterized membrane protein